jgi:hypothetical protein
MKSLRDYITEADAWASNPAQGDEFDIELAPDQLIESWVVEVTEDGVVLAADDSMIAMLESRGMLSERIARYGAVGSSPGMGHSLTEQPVDEDEPVAEDMMSRILELAGMASTLPLQPNPNAARTDPLAQKAADLAPVGTEKDPATATTMDEGVMSDIDIDLQQIAQNQDPGELIGALQGEMGANTAEYLKNMMDEIEQEMERSGRSFQNDVYRNLDILMDRIVAQYADQDMNEAEYQGRKVPLGKPMRGDVAKFKVYVRDPKTGNVKKVNFGHGGTSAKRAGQKTMRIKKSDPARRKSFRARHRCDNPGPRTKARYWACRAW